MDRVHPGDVLVPWECITQILALFRDKAKSRSGFNLITVQMIAWRQEHFGAETLAPCGNMSCDSGAVESHHSIPWEEAPYFRGMVSVFREIEEDISENSVEQQHSVQKAPEQAVLVGRYVQVISACPGAAGSGCRRVALHFGNCEGRWFFWSSVALKIGRPVWVMGSTHWQYSAFPTKEMGFECNLACKYYLFFLVGQFHGKLEEVIL